MEEALIEDVLCRVGTIRTPLQANFIHPEPANKFAKKLDTTLLLAYVTQYSQQNKTGIAELITAGG